MAKKKPITEMSSAESREERERDQERRAENAERLRAIREPAALRGVVAPATGPGQSAPDPTAGAGPVWLEAHEAGDAETLAELAREREEREALAGSLAVRIDQLRRREKQAAEEEARAAAPKDAKRLAKQAKKLVAQAVETADAARAARGAAAETLAALGRARQLAGEDTDSADGLDPATLREWWALEGTNDRGELEVLVDGRETPDGRPALVRRYLEDVTRLVALPERAVEDVAAFLAPADAGQLAEHRALQARRDARSRVARELALAIAAGEEAGAEELAARAIARARPSRRSSFASRRGEAYSYLERRRARELTG